MGKWDQQEKDIAERNRQSIVSAKDRNASARVAAQQKRIEKNLSAYDDYSKGQFDDLTRGFRQFSEAQTGRAMGNVLRQSEIGSTRRGIAFSGLAGGSAMDAQANLQGQALGAQQSFANQLGAMQSQNRDAFLRGEFAFANDMEKMFRSQQFEEKMFNMQAQLMKDQQSRDAFYGLAGSIGAFVGGGPIGAAIGGQFKDWFGGTDYNYSTGAGQSVQGYGG